MAFKPFDPNSRVRVTQQDLPHWRQDGTTYFITSRLADSIPKAVADDWRNKREAWLIQHGATSAEDLADEFRLDYQRQFSDRFHEFLDAGHGECWLARMDCAGVLIHKMIEGQGTCFDLGAWCIMPNHIHALVTPAKGSALGDIVQHWKGGSSFSINRLLDRSGPFWFKEPFDHIVRSAAQLRRLSEYVADNPMTAGLKTGFVLGFGKEAGLSREDLRSRIDKRWGGAPARLNNEGWDGS